MTAALCRTEILALFLLAASASAGCASRPIPYETVALTLEYSGRRTVAVAVRDGRPQTRDGQRDPSVVGETLTGGARKAAVTTGTGESLASIVAAAVTAALEAGGFSPLPVETAPGDDREAVIGRALAAKPDYLWLIDVDDWWTARHKRTTHTYELAFAMLDATGAVMVERAFQGTLRWDENGNREGGPDGPVAEDAPVPRRAPAPTADAPDPDAFERATSEPPESASAEAPAGDDESADDAPAAVNASDGGEPISDCLVRLLGELLGRMINDPEVPKRMVRFP
jgi:hypothetical protein